MSKRRNVKIKSAALHKEIFLKGAYVEVMGKLGEQTHNFSANIAVHADLRNVFQRLAGHAIKLAEIYDKDGLVPEDHITILGFSISGENEQEGLTISCARTLANGNVVSINTPFQKWDDQVTPYVEAEELSLIIEDCKAEVYAYVFENKHQPDNQLTLFAEALPGQEGEKQSADDLGI